MKKKFMSLLIILILALSVFAGCGKKQSAENKVRTVVDMAGRSVSIPTKVEKVYTPSPIGTIVMYTLDEKKLVGLNYKLSDIEKKYTSEYYKKLPVLGGWFGKGNTGNVEEIIKAKPDVIISMGDINNSSKSQAEDLQKKLGTPVLLVDGKLENMDKAYEFLGDIIGEKERAKELGNYCKKTTDETKAAVANVPQEKRIKVYYAEGTKGLETDPKGSPHTEVLDLVGGINVADVPLKSGYGRSEVSIEQVLSWNPDMIIVGADAGFATNSLPSIMKDPAWKNIKAVKEKQVYQIPFAPFSWFDRPPAVNRIIGVKWLANLLYPDYVKIDLKAETKEFYKLFYHRDLTEAEVNELLQNAERR